MDESIESSFIGTEEDLAENMLESSDSDSSDATWTIDDDRTLDEFIADIPWPTEWNRRRIGSRLPAPPSDSDSDSLSEATEILFSNDSSDDSVTELITEEEFTAADVLPPEKTTFTRLKNFIGIGKGRPIMSKGAYLLWILGSIIVGVLIYQRADLKSFGGSQLAYITKYLYSNSGAGQSEKPLNVADTNGWKYDPKPGARLLTDDEIRYVEGGKLYLVIIGHVFDVTKGSKSYSPGSGYHGFIGRDASRAFITGDFTEQGLVSDVEGLQPDDYAGLIKWIDFYFDAYDFVGYHIGRFVDEQGKGTQDLANFKESVAKSQKVKEAEGNVKKAFPPCNMEWKAETGTKYWCSTKSGGIERKWEGYPHQFTEDGGKSARCACIKELGKKDRRIRAYEKCTDDKKVCFQSKQD